VESTNVTVYRPFMLEHNNTADLHDQNCQITPYVAVNYFFLRKLRWLLLNKCDD
jgi:hypothetical protein